MKYVELLFAYFCSNTGLSFSHTYTEADSLRSTLLSGYNTELRPLSNQSQVLRVNIALAMYHLGTFDEVTGQFSIGGLFTLTWKDEKLTWTPSSNGGVTEVLFKPSEIWVPPVSLINPFEDLIYVTKYDFMRTRVFSDGTVVWTPANILEVFCSVDVTYYPYDLQTCSLDVIPYGYGLSEVLLSPSSSTVDQTSLEHNGEWSFAGSEVVAHNLLGTSQVDFKIKLRRRPLYMVVNFLLPILLITILNGLVFLLPVDSGERLSFSVTLVLSMSVFFTILNDYIPGTSDQMSSVSYYLLMSFMLNCYVCIAIVLNMRLYHKSESVPIPIWCVRFSKFINKRNCFKNSQVADLTVQTDAHSHPDFETEDKRKIDNHGREKCHSKTLTDETVTWRDVSLAVDKCHFVVVGLLQLTVALIFIIIVFTN